MGFGEDLEAFERKATGRIRLFRRAIVMKVSARVILRTPVDTGRARANWQVSMGAPAGGVVEAVDKTGTDTLQKIKEFSVAIDHDDQPLFITNNQPYIEKLEEGSSDQAPNGMVAITVAEFDGLAEQVRNQVQGDTSADT